jgi:hypothetical protein
MTSEHWRDIAAWLWSDGRVGVLPLALFLWHGRARGWWCLRSDLD